MERRARGDRCRPARRMCIRLEVARRRPGPRVVRRRQHLGEAATVEPLWRTDRRALREGERQGSHRHRRRWVHCGRSCPSTPPRRARRTVRYGDAQRVAECSAGCLCARPFCGGDHPRIPPGAGGVPHPSELAVGNLQHRRRRGEDSPALRRQRGGCPVRDAWFSSRQADGGCVPSRGIRRDRRRRPAQPRSLHIRRHATPGLLADDRPGGCCRAVPGYELDRRRLSNAGT